MRSTGFQNYIIYLLCIVFISFANSRFFLYKHISYVNKWTVFLQIALWFLWLDYRHCNEFFHPLWINTCKNIRTYMSNTAYPCWFHYLFVMKLFENLCLNKLPLHSQISVKKIEAFMFKPDMKSSLKFMWYWTNFFPFIFKHPFISD